MGGIFYVHTVTPSVITYILSDADIILPLSIMVRVNNFTVLLFRQGILIPNSIQNYPKSNLYLKKLKLKG
jgi:hypothetical protein